MTEAGASGPVPRVVTASHAAVVEEITRRAHTSFFLAAPFVTRAGLRLIENCLKPGVHIRMLTCLVPESILSGSVDPASLLDFTARLGVELFHLPRLHAKVYIADTECALVTSANLTAGGLRGNLECGVRLSGSAEVTELLDRMSEFSALGGVVRQENLARIANIARAEAERIEQARRQCRRIPATLRDATRQLQIESLRTRLSGNSLTGTFARSIEYILRHRGPLTTIDLNKHLKDLQPDICDDSIDLLIDGQNFGMKWKHTARNAQQQLKRAGVIVLENRLWRLRANGGSAA